MDGEGEGCSLEVWEGGGECSVKFKGKEQFYFAKV